MATSFGQIEALAVKATEYRFRQLEERVAQLEKALEESESKKKETR